MADYVANMDWALEFQRTGKFPLDASSVFESYADAVKYAKGDTSDPDSRGLCGTSYVGQVISVVTNSDATVYKIKADRTLEEVGRIPDVDDKSIEVKSGKLQLFGFDGALAGQQVRVKNVGTTEAPVLKLEWFTPSSVDVDALQEQVNDIDDIVGKAASGDKPATGLVKDVGELKTTKANSDDVYTKTEVDAKLKGAIHFKDTYESLAALKAAVEAGTVKPEVGDMYNIRTAGGTDVHGVAVKAGDNVIYVQTATDPAAYGWDNAGGTIDLGDYYNKTEVDNKLADKVDKVTGSSLVADTEITRLGSLTKIEASTTNGNIKSTDKDGKVTELTVYTLPAAKADALGGIKSTAASKDNANKVTVAADGTASVDNVDPDTLTGAVAEAKKTSYKLKIGSKEFDGSAAVEVTASDIPLPTNVAKTDAYATASTGGTVKSSSDQDKVAVGTDGIMSVNDISASKVKGAVSEASKVSNKLTIGSGENKKEYDGSAAVTVTGEDIKNLLPNLVEKSDYGTATNGGTVKSSSDQDKVAIGADGTMSLNDVSASKVKGTVSDSEKLAGIAGTDILVKNGDNLTAKVKNAAAADALANGVKVELKGDATATQASWDGSADLSLNVTLAEVLTPAAGTYTKVTVNKKGQVTNAENLSASDIPNLTLDKITDAGDLAGKDKVGTADFDSTLTTAWNSLQTNEHTHSNKTVLDAITAAKVAAWDKVTDKADKATTLNGYGITDAYTKTEVNGLLTGVFHYRDSYASFVALTAAIADSTITEVAVGDVYNIQAAGGTDRHGIAIKAGDNVVVASVTGEAAPYTVTWDVLSGTVDLSSYATTTWVTTNFAGKTDFESLKEIVSGSDDVTGLVDIVGDTSKGLVKDVNALKDTVGDTSKGLVKAVDALEDTVGDSTSGLVKDVNTLKDTVGDSTKGLVKGVADLNTKVTDITKDNGTIDTKISAHNSAADAHSALFNAKQNKAIKSSVTFATSDFVTNTDTSVDAAYMATKTVSDLTASKSYWADLAVDGKSIASALSAKFVPVSNVNNGSLTVYSNAVPTAAVTVNAKFTEIQE